MLKTVHLYFLHIHFVCIQVEIYHEFVPVCTTNPKHYDQSGVEYRLQLLQDCWTSRQDFNIVFAHNGVIFYIQYNHRI